jgi:hypothetical protein
VLFLASNLQTTDESNAQVRLGIEGNADSDSLDAKRWATAAWRRETGRFGQEQKASTLPGT